MAGPWFCAPIRPGMAGGGHSRHGGLALVVVRLLSLLFASLGLGATLAVVWPILVGGQPPFATMSGEFARLIWTEGLSLFRDFPLGGDRPGGSFGTVYPYVKTHDAS